MFFFWPQTLTGCIGPYRFVSDTDTRLVANCLYRIVSSRINVSTYWIRRIRESRWRGVQLCSIWMNEVTNHHFGEPTHDIKSTRVNWIPLHIIFFHTFQWCVIVKLQLGRVKELKKKKKDQELLELWESTPCVFFIVFGLIGWLWWDRHCHICPYSGCIYALVWFVAVTDSRTAVWLKRGIIYTLRIYQIWWVVTDQWGIKLDHGVLRQPWLVNQ